MKHLVLTILCLLFLAGCNQNQTNNAVVTFDGGSLTLEDLQAHQAIMKRSSQFSKNPDQVTPEFAYEHAVNMEMIITRALKEKLHQDPRIRAEIHEFMADLFLKVMQDSLVPQIDKESLTEEEVRAYFDANIASYIPPTLYGVRVIENPDQNVIRTARDRILTGGESFETVALDLSTHNASRESGGFLGQRAITSYRPDWRAAIEPLAVDALSEPVQIKNAWYLFQVTAKTEFEAPDFEEKKAYVRNDLLYSKYREAWRVLYDQMRTDYKVKVDEKRLQVFLNQGEKS
jgi:parvulin-like peptidyl-prolyl isomerase